jgi:hypothetical protein
MITASLTGDITRFSHADASGIVAGLFAETPLDGETIGFTVGAGRAIGEAWGVAFEFGRTGEIESRSVQDIDWRLATGPIRLPPPDFPVPIDVSFESRAELRLTMFSALAWVKHQAGSRVELTYTGGLSFVRSDSSRQFTITDPRLLAIWALPAATEVTEHRAAPVVGMDAAIAFTDHTALTAGIRATAIQVSGTPGWLVRPGIGVRWRF